jgi:hypothetical protein
MPQSPVPLTHAVQFLQDQNGNPLNDSSAVSTPIFDGAKNPVQDPSGRQLTLADFTTAQGALSVDCISTGTRVVLRLWGLVPKGNYSVGVMLPGSMGASTRVGALSDDPAASSFQADSTGQADLVITKSAGPLSESGMIPACLQAGLLSSVMEQPVAQIIGYYHSGSVTVVPQFLFTLVRLMRLNNEIVDGQKNPVTDASSGDTPLYEFRQNQPVLAPARPGNNNSPRHQITLQEFRTVSGTIAARCTDSGTHVAMALSGLIPHGTYTVWVAKPDPTDPTHMKMIGVGALGKTDGSENNFVADENGVAYISATNPGGALSTFGDIAPCWLTGEPMVQIAGVYHIDGQTHGPVIGPDGTYVGQFAFAFMAMPPQAPAPAAAG